MSVESFNKMWRDKFSNPVVLGNYVTFSKGGLSQIRQGVLNQQIQELALSVVKKAEALGFQISPEQVADFLAKLPNDSMSDPLNMWETLAGKLTIQDDGRKLSFQDILCFAMETVKELKSEIAELSSHDFRRFRNEKELVGAYNAWIENG